MSTIIQEEHILGTQAIKPLYRNYSFATLGSTLSSGAAVLLEGIIIGQSLGAYGFSTLGIIMPISYLLMALATGFAAGISSTVAVHLGKNDQEGARKVFGQGICTAFLLSAAIALLMFFNAEALAKLLGATPDLLENSAKFIRVYALAFPLSIPGQSMDYTIRSDGKPGFSTAIAMITNITALVWLFVSLNVLHLDLLGVAVYYVLVFGLYIISGLYYIFNKKTNLKIRLSDFKLNFKVLKQPLQIGFPSFLLQAATVVYSVVVNNYLGTYGTSSDIAIFAIINGYVAYIVTLISLGLTNGMLPIASYNYGAKKPKRLRELIKVSVVANLIITGIITICIVVFARPLFVLFSGDAELAVSGSVYLRIMMSMAMFGQVAALVSGYFQAVEQVVKSILTGISRYIIFAVPLIIIFSRLWGNMGIWYALAAGDLLAGLLSILLIVKEYKKLNTAS